METINHECYVSLEVAKLLKKVEFNWEVKTYYYYLSPYDEYNLVFSSISTNYNHTVNADFSAPTLDVAQRWLREVHHLHITVFSSSQESWMFRITKKHQMLEDGVYGEDFYTYEEALEAGIKKALEIILEN